MNLTYSNSSTQNNGKITSQTDNISGEQVVYTYDALNRLASAAATSNSWGQSFSYDGFGNLTGQTVTAGSAPSYSVTPDPSTNHLGGEDANGNTPYSNDANGTNYVMTYDVENRYTGSLTSTGLFMYGYAPGNKRVYRGVENGNNLVTDEVTYWSPTGQKLATYQMVLNGSQYIAVQTGTYYWFGRKLIKNANGYVAADGLGSIGHFYPYGLEKPSATTNGTEKFTGYLRDAETGLDYAKNRYHDPGTGRFMTPDPYIASVGPADPRSWNRYTYTRGDPVNRVDRSGLDDCDKDSSDPNCDGGDGGSCFDSTYCDSGGGGCFAASCGNPPGGGSCFVESGCEDPGPGGGGGDPGGGGQPQAPPPCPPIYQAWINTYGAYAVATGLSEANVLALSAIESGWGGGRFATQGKDFFNLETIWKPGTPKPAPKFAYQNGWLQAKEMFTSGPYKGEYALVATYNTASDSFASFAAKLGTYFTDVTDPATFGNIAVKHGEYGGRGANFVNTALTFMHCLQ